MGGGGVRVTINYYNMLHFIGMVLLCHSLALVGTQVTLMDFLYKVPYDLILLIRSALTSLGHSSPDHTHWSIRH